MRDWLEPLGILLALISIIFLVVIGCQVIFNVNYCNNLAELNPDRRFEWRFFGGCFMETEEGVWQGTHDIIFLDKPINGGK